MLFFLLIWLMVDAVATAYNVSCDPCIDRPSYTIQALVHGATDPSWLQIRAAAAQAAADMRVHLDFQLYDNETVDQMANDILNVAANHRPHALIVNIPSNDVKDAVSAAIAQGVPVFGINSGYDMAKDLGVLAFVAMDDYLAGTEAAKQFRSFSGRNITNALFVNHAYHYNKPALDQRFRGFREMLQLENITNPAVQVDELALDLGTNGSSDQLLLEQLAGCPYDAVLLASHESLEVALDALSTNGCTSLLGTFDVSLRVYQAIAVGDLHFAVSQQPYLQGALAVVLASVYATTGKTVIPSLETQSGLYSTGPYIVTFENLPIDTFQLCENDSFPVCPNTKASDGVTESECPCIDRSKVKIGGITHGLEIDPFWQNPFAQAFQAAVDLGVELDWDLIKQQDDDNILYAKMANKIISLCREGIHGLFLSISNEAVVPAIEECQKLNVPVMSINSGAMKSRELGLIHYVGQDEYAAGFEAGKSMVASGMVIGICPNPRPSSVHLAQRCKGFEDAIVQTLGKNVTYIGMPQVAFDSLAMYVQQVEAYIVDNVDLTEDWDGLGILMLSASMLPEAVALRDRHSELLIGTFDKSDQVFKAIEDGEVLFGIAQGSYLQGYLPVWLLTLLSTTNQRLSNAVIMTGPTLVEEAPSMALKTCETNLYEVCPPPENHDYNYLEWVRWVGYALLGIVYVTSTCFALWVLWNRKKPVVANAQPFFLYMVCAGTIIMGSAILPWSIDDGMVSVEGCDKACMAAPWLLTIGFTIVFCALFGKLWRINKLISSARRFQRRKVTIWRVMPPLATLLLLQVVFMLVWTLVDPMRWERIITSEQSSYGICQLGQTGVSVAMFSLVMFVDFCALVLANIQAYQTREVSLQFSESRFIFMIMIGILQISIIAIPVIALVYTNPGASFFAKSAYVFVLCMTIVLLLFVPKICYLHREEGGEVRSGQSVRESTSHRKPNAFNDRFSAKPNETFLGGCGGIEPPSGDVPVNKLSALAELLRQKGIDAIPLLEEAGLSLPPDYPGGSGNRDDPAALTHKTDTTKSSSLKTTSKSLSSSGIRSSCVDRDPTKENG